MRRVSFWNDIISRTLTIYANVIFLVLWVGFAIALFVNREWLEEIWSWTQALPTVPKIVVTVAFLPVIAVLWIWESSWSTVGRVLGFAGMAAWTLLAVYSLFKYQR